MKQTRLLMGMPITIEIIDPEVDESVFDFIYNYFHQVDERYSTYKKTSEISQINKGLPRSKWSKEMKTVLDQCEQTKRETSGFFDISRKGQLDPSGLVKGWAINNAAKKIRLRGIKNFYIEAGGDIQVSGLNKTGKLWQVGLRNPFNRTEIIKTLALSNQGVATSGTYVRGQHIYNPNAGFKPADQVASLTVVGADIYNADRYATAAFAMGKTGIDFIESLVGYEAYMVDHDKIATLTSGFERYVLS